MTIASESSNSLSETLFAGGGEMRALMRSHDWANTPLGPVENWSPTLRTLVSTILASRFPQCIFWGEDYIQIYNDAMIVIYEAYHPHALGQPLRETWSEVWDNQLKPMYEGVRKTGEAVFAEDLMFQILRSGDLEEAYMTVCHSPVWDEAGKFGGMFCTATETTQQVIGRRRLAMLRELATAGGGAKTLQSACTAAADTLNPYDIPFALFYQVNSEDNLAELVATSGLTPDSAAAPATMMLTPNDPNHLTEPSHGWLLAEVFQSREPLLLTDVIDRFGALPGGAWAESSRSAMILPILSSDKEQVECLLVVGISPRLPFNSEYRSFLELVAQQVESSIATARSYEAERKRAEALAELDRAKTTFFSNVSHEFRTPLTLMLGPLEDALRSLREWESGRVGESGSNGVEELGSGKDSSTPAPQPPSTLKELLQLAHRNGLRLLKLVNTLLDFSRTESDRIQAVYEATDLATLTAELASVFRSAIERAKLRFVIDCPPLPEPVYVDRGMWEKIVFNLISNAFKFTFTGEIRVSLFESDEFSVLSSQLNPELPTQNSKFVVLEVCDTGTGIPATAIPHLFERFYQVKGAQGRTFEGSGIGLSLCQELVKLHGGTIQVSSVEGEGSCFRVIIPTGCAHLPSEQIQATQILTSTAMTASPYVEEVLQWLTGSDQSIIHSEAIQSTFAPTYEHVSSSVKSRILLVDDNADMQNYVERLLSQRHQVKTAANGAIALEMIGQQLPDLVLTDVMMPEIDGFQLLKILRADPITESIPIILLSARAGKEATVEGLEAGADDYLIKPFSAHELIARVETQLQMSRLRQELSANRFKNEFLMTVTHELQSPLATILGWTRFLQTKSLKPNAMVKALAAIERNAMIEAKLVKNLLDMASILSGKLRLKSQIVDLTSLIQNATATFRETAQAKQLHLTEVISNEVQGDVVADGDRLRQVVTNLLENAIKFTPEGGRVEVNLSVVEGQRTHDKLCSNYN